MHIFFHDLRRKSGCITLVVALATTAGWIRSLVMVDGIAEFGHQGKYNLFSSREAIHFEQLISERYFLDSYNRDRRRAHWYSHPYRSATVSSEVQAHSVEWHTQWWQFENREESRPQWIGTSYRYRTWAVPYWAIATPLTLLSLPTSLETSETIANMTNVNANRRGMGSFNNPTRRGPN